MAKVTSANGALAAASTAPMRFVAASELGRSDERCAPTRMTGTGRFWSAKLSAAAVYAIVSVPWAMTMPFAPCVILSATVFAISPQCLGVMFSL